MMKTKIVLCAIPLFFYGFLTQAEGVEGSLIDESTEAVMNWSVDDAVFPVLITAYKKEENENIKGRKLAIYQENNFNLKKIYEFDAGLDRFISMFELGDNSNVLVTIWMGGSAYHINVLSSEDGKISTVLTSGSPNFPEFADVDNNGKLEILISEGSFLIDEKQKKVLDVPDNAVIYKWDGHNFHILKKVPWAKRFK